MKGGLCCLGIAFGTFGGLGGGLDGGGDELRDSCFDFGFVVFVETSSESFFGILYIIESEIADAWEVEIGHAIG